MYEMLTAIEIGLYEKIKRVKRYAYAIKEPANRDRNSEAVSGLVAKTGI